MRYILLIPLIGLLCSSCKEKKDNQIEIVSADAKFDFGISYDLRLYSDSMYLFTLMKNNFNHEINEKYRGRYLLANDTIIFSPFQFEFLDANKAVIKNNFIEFLDGKFPFKMKVLKSNIPTTQNVDTARYNSYVFFTFNSKFYTYFTDSVKPYDLINDDLIIIDSILNSCIKNNNRITKNINDYNKQCLAVCNSKNEKEVWIYCLCKKHSFGKNEYQFQITRVMDGGDCFFSLKINLAKRKYYSLSINGLA